MDPQVPIIATAVLVDDSNKTPSAPPGHNPMPPPSPSRRPKGYPPIHDISQESLSSLYSTTIHSYTPGLAKAVGTTLQTFPLRIWVIDNSGSMAAGDGNRIVTNSSGQTKVIPCTRWEEIHECVTYHARLAQDIQAPTEFRMLNPNSVSGEIMHMGLEGVGFQEGMGKVYQVMHQMGPGGVTPLSRHIHAIKREIESMRVALEQAGKKVCVVLATDGLPSDNHGYSTQAVLDQFVKDLRTLEGLPIWVVVRLCTDEDNVTEFYNELDSQVELSLEVIDDFMGEAKEVYEHNPWLNYGLPLHRMREWGFSDKLLDLLDERPLFATEVKNFMAFLFGTNAWDAPDPSVDWKEFVNWVDANQKKLRPTYNVMTKTNKPWIDIKKLNAKYGDGSGCTIS
mmetsp:Transcript_27066/g.51275  ORF Transcript_27066/g.51275 Transcript_27066/m.51275 type:complete len:395 (-) Transcript_27066:84-1268(-)|eukprot:CAMPEP_0182490380 /NCGR_PEP_ID=MMETSP1321-20130603/252_1 /TAXON_ID=91990 /ORGANISM="Bolidomonas sp., Strain RCC1657" /LENGTH=394 /DNA_ID=CAMNT_0024692547 /DNA_START=85 /DNA_END=1269 /DNA_ORIENTATION=-